MFLRNTVKLCFEELGHRNLTEKKLPLYCIFYSFVTAQCLTNSHINQFPLANFAKICLFRDFWAYMNLPNYKNVEKPLHICSNSDRLGDIQIIVRPV